MREIRVALGDALEDSPAGKAAAAVLPLVERAVATTLVDRGVESAEVSITLMDDDSMAQLNSVWLGRAGPTDVIAFPLDDPGQVVGDVYIGLQQARRQAAELDLPLEEELVRLAVHGALHLLGFDHPEGEERERSEMWREQERLVRQTLEGREGGRDSV